MIIARHDNLVTLISFVSRSDLLKIEKFIRGQMNEFSCYSPINYYKAAEQFSHVLFVVSEFIIVFDGKARCSATRHNCSQWK